MTIAIFSEIQMHFEAQYKDELKVEGSILGKKIKERGLAEICSVQPGE